MQREHAVPNIAHAVLHVHAPALLRKRRANQLASWHFLELQCLEQCQHLPKIAPKCGTHFLFPRWLHLSCTNSEKKLVESMGGSGERGLGIFEDSNLDQTRRSDAGPTPRAAAARVRVALYYIAAAALVAECLVPAACVDFPPGCNDALEDYLDQEELWDNAFQYGVKGMFDEARTCFEVYVCNQPTSERAWHLLAEVHGRMGNPEGALRHAQVASRIGGENASAAEGHFLLANAYMQVLEYGKARQSYYRAIRLDENHVNSMVNLGVVLGNNNDYAEAIPIYRRALKAKPDLMAARHNLGSALHTLKVFHEALSVLEPLVVDEPDCYECWLSLGHTLSEVKQLARATACYKKGMDIRPHDPDALLNYYFTKQQVIDWEERDELFERLKKVTEEQLAQA